MYILPPPPHPCTPTVKLLPGNNLASGCQPDNETDVAMGEWAGGREAGTDVGVCDEAGLHA